MVKGSRIDTHSLMLTTALPSEVVRQCARYISVVVWKDQGEPWWLAINERFPYDLLGDRGEGKKVDTSCRGLQGGCSPLQL